MRDALRCGLGKLRLSDVEAAFEARIARPGEFVETKHYRATAPGARYTTEWMRGLELECIDRMLEGKGKTEAIREGLTRDEFRERFKHREMDGQKITLSDAQLWMGFKVLTAPDQYMIVRGAAGSGKSTSIAPIAELAAVSGAFREEGYEVVGLAPTGGAAKNLEDLGVHAQTLQLHLARKVKPEAKRRLYIMDEGSLANTDQMHQFVASVRPQDRVVIAYDPRQHQGVGAGRIVEEMEEAGVTTVRLEKVIRQQKNPELLAVVNDLKEGQVLRGLEKLDDMACLWQIPDRRKRLEVMASYYAEHRDECDMTAPDNRTIDELNAAARHEFRRRGWIGEDRYTARVLIGVRDLQVADRKRAASYQPGDVIRWGKKSLGRAVQSGDYAEVVSRDAERNLVTMRVAGSLGLHEVTYDPSLAYGVGDL